MSDLLIAILVLLAIAWAIKEEMIFRAVMEKKKKKHKKQTLDFQWNI